VRPWLRAAFVERDDRLRIAAAWHGAGNGPKG
jgi:hypothetical protein